MMQHFPAAWLALAAAALAPASAAAQTTVTRVVSAPVAPLGGDTEERARVDQLLGRDSLDGFLLRSPSSRSARLGRARDDAGADTAFVAVWWPELLVVRNSALPFSVNDGALWAGRGASVSVTGGVRARYRYVHLTLAPTYVSAANEDFPLPTNPAIAPPIPPGRSPYSYPWRVYGPSIDLPLRFGGEPYRALDFGQSALYAGYGPVEAGISNENEWWGPGIRNALVLSSHAAGVPKFFVRTARPLDTPVGTVEARYVLGSLSDSPFFSVGPLSGYGRSLNAAAVTIRPRGVPTLTMGFARSVFAQLDGSSLLGHAFDVLSVIGRPNALPVTDPSQTPGRDQIYSLFARWVLPDDGFESYAEWGRTEFPANLRDAFVSPNHTQGYTVGLQYARPVPRAGATARVQAEMSSVAQSNTFRQRPTGSWYTSRAAIQGYTQRGQVLGAAIGPGSSSQWLAADLFGGAWSAGLFLGRIRWDDDAYYTTRSPSGGSCGHDVSVFRGVRASGRYRGGALTASVTDGSRLNVFYQNTDVCFSGDANPVDNRNTTVSLNFVPPAFW